MLISQLTNVVAKLLPVAAFTMLSQLAIAQSDLTNNSGFIELGSTGTIYVNGSIEVQGTGQFQNDGTIELIGDWYNQSTGGAFTSTSNGLVLLSGANQLIGGSAPTQFPSITLQGTDNKTLGNAITVTGVLSLGNKNLNAALYAVEITNDDSAAVVTTGGFIYTGTLGSLIRHTNSTQSYLYPLGEWASGTYRPAYFTPTTIQARVLGAEFKYNTPTNSGYDVNNRDSAICTVNPGFFYIAKPISGGTDYLVDMSYDVTVDGAYQKMAAWGTQWDTTINNSTYNNGGLSWVKGGSLPLGSTQPLALTRNIATPVVNISQSNGYCLGDTLTLSVTPNFVFYDWSNGGTSDTAWALQNGQYQVTVNQAFNCWAVSAPLSVVFDTITTPTLSISGNNAICDGDSLMVVAPAGYTSYTWSNGTNNDTVYLASAGTYNLTVSNGTNCTASALNDVVLTVNAPLLPTLIASNYTGICAQDSIELAVLEFFNSYNWSSGSTDSTDNVFADGTYNVTVTDSNNCVSSDSISISRTNLPSPVADFSFTITGQSLELTDLSTNADSYQWIINQQPAGTTADLSYPLPASGSYEVCLTASNACSSTTVCDTITYVGIDAVALTTLQIYPNPTADFVNIKASQLNKTAVCRLYDALGREMIETELKPQMQTRIDMRMLAAGQYHLEVVAGDARQTYEIDLLKP